MDGRFRGAHAGVAVRAGLVLGRGGAVPTERVPCYRS